VKVRIDWTYRKDDPTVLVFGNPTVEIPK